MPPAACQPSSRPTFSGRCTFGGRWDASLLCRAIRVADGLCLQQLGRAQAQLASSAREIIFRFKSKPVKNQTTLNGQIISKVDIQTRPMPLSMTTNILFLPYFYASFSGKRAGRSVCTHNFFKQKPEPVKSRQHDKPNPWPLVAPTGRLYFMHIL